MNKLLSLIALAAIAGAAISQPSLSRPIVQGSGIAQNADQELGGFRIDIRRAPTATDANQATGSFRFNRFNAAANTGILSVETRVKSCTITGNQATFAGPTRVKMRTATGALIVVTGMLQGTAVDNRPPNSTTDPLDTIAFVFTGASITGPITFSGEVISGDIRVRRVTAPVP